MVKTTGVDFSTLTNDELIKVANELKRRAGRYRVERDVAQRRVIELEKSVYVDALTGVGNRRAFDKAIIHELERAKRGEGKTPLSLVLVDIDHFKLVNDTHGHQTGDAMLRAMGQILLGHARVTDGIFRYGGEEFAVILPALSGKDVSTSIERLRASVEDELVVLSKKKKRVQVRATASFGVTATRESELVRGTDLTALADALVGRADDALYRAKHEGRNRVVQR